MKPFKYAKFNKKAEKNLKKAQNDISRLVKSAHSGFEDGISHAGQKKGQSNQSLDRKSLRKMKRKEKKTNRLQYSQFRSSATQQSKTGSSGKSPGQINKAQFESSKTNEKSKKKVSFQTDDDVDEDAFSDDGSDFSGGEQNLKGKAPLAPSLKSKHDQLAEDKLADEREIKRLSKKLRLKPGKIPKSFYGDGDLGTLLELCEMKFDNEVATELQEGEETYNGTEKLDYNVNDVECDEEIDSEEIDSDLGDSDYEEKSAAGQESDSEDDEAVKAEKSTSGNLKTGKKSSDKKSGKEVSNKPSKLDEDLDNFSDDDSDDDEPQAKAPKFDPYAGASKYYVPPQKRAQNKNSTDDGSDKSMNPTSGEKVSEQWSLSDEFDRIYRQCVGLFNRVSETNLGAISKQMQVVYTKFSTTETNIAVTKAAINLCCLAYSVADRLIFEKMALVAVVHKSSPNDLGAQFIHSITWKMWNNGLKNEDESQRGFGNDLVSDKTVLNCVKCLCFLYNFGVVSHKLIFDVIKKFLSCFTMTNIESLISIILTSGFVIRKKSPTDLKDIILAILKTGQDKLSLFEENDRPRVQFFLDLVTALKNNNRRKVETSVDIEAFHQIQDVVKNLSKDDGSAILVSISLQEILDAGEFGRWWNLGINGASTGSLEKDQVQVQSKDNSGGTELIELAHRSGMNTQFRESLFCAIMTSCDYVEAVDKIVRLKGLKKHIREVPHVIIKCALLEQSFNPFYFHLLKGFSLYEKNHKIIVKFAISDRLKDVKMMTADSELSVFAQLFTCLLEDEIIPLNIIKLLSPTNLTDIAQKFCRKFLLAFLALPKQTLKKWCVELLQDDDSSEIYHHLHLLVKQNQAFISAKSKVLGDKKQKMILDNIQLICTSDN